MKVLVQTAGNGYSWAEPGTSRARFINATKQLLGKSLVAAGPNFSTQIREFVKTHQLLGEVLFDCLNDIPSFTAVKPVHPDFVIGPELSFEESGSAPAFLAAVNIHSGLAEVGEARDLFYERNFGNCAPYARRIDFVDAYGLSNLLDSRRKTGMRWLLLEKWAQLPIEVNLFTQLPDSNREYGQTRSWPIDDIRQNLDQLGAELARMNARMHLKIDVFDRAKYRHDRFARLVFEKNSISMELSKGAEIFATPLMSEAYKLHSLETSEFNAKYRSWLSQDAAVLNWES